MMEVLRHSLVSSGGSLGRLAHAGGSVGVGGDDSNNVSGGGGVSPQTTLNSPLSDSSAGNFTLRSLPDSSGGGGGATGFYSEPEELKSEDASSVASGLTSADSSAPVDPSKDR